MNHPFLPCGFNSWDNNGDEVDGGGVNYPPLSPVHFVSFQERDVMILTPEMLEIFEVGCPDIVFPHQPNTIVFPREVRTQDIRRRA